MLKTTFVEDLGGQNDGKQSIVKVTLGVKPRKSIIIIAGTCRGELRGGRDLGKKESEKSSEV